MSWQTGPAAGAAKPGPCSTYTAPCKVHARQAGMPGVVQDDTRFHRAMRTRWSTESPWSGWPHEFPFLNGENSRRGTRFRRLALSRLLASIPGSPDNSERKVQLRISRQAEEGTFNYFLSLHHQRRQVIECQARTFVHVWAPRLHSTLGYLLAPSARLA